MDFLNAENMLQYFNYTAIGLIGLGALWGFIRGFYKTTYAFIWTAGILVLAFIFMGPAAQFIMSFDISMVDQYVDIGIPITSIKETVPLFLINQQPNLANVLVEGSDALALVLGFTQMAVQLVYLILVYVLNLTIFKFFGWILWLFIKPKKRDSEGNKRKKTFVSRLLGSGVGALRGAFIIVLISIPISGLLAFSSALDLVIAQTASNQPQYQLILMNDELVLVEIQKPYSETSDLLEEAKLLLQGYRNTYMGQIAGLVKIENVELDTFIFDEIFKVSVKTDNLDTDVKFRAELEKALEALNIIIEANEGSLNFDDTLIYKLSSDDVTSIFDLLSDLKIIEVVIPVGLEYLINSGQFDDMIAGYEDLLNLEDLKAIDYLSDLGLIGDVFGNVLSLIQSQEVPLSEINYLIFDGETVTDIFTSLSQIDLIEYGLPLGLNYALQMQEVVNLIEEQGLTKDDLTLPDQASLMGDFLAIADLYVAIQGLGFQSFDEFETLTQPEVLSTISDQTVSDIMDALFGFSLVSSNTTLMAGIIYDQLIANLPAEYQAFITREDIISNFNAAEISNLVLLAKVVVSTGIIEALSSENPDYTTILSDENIESIVNRISNSNLISSKMNDVIAQLLTQLNLGVTLVIPSEINWAEASGRAELTALLKGAREILSVDLTSGDFSALDDQAIDRLSAALGASLVIRYNLNAIFEMVASEANLGDFEIVLPESYLEWTELEINSLLKAAKILQVAGSNPDALLALSEQDIHTIALSKVISNTFAAVFTDMVDVGGDFEGLLYVPENLTWYSSDSSIGELEYMLLALKEIVPPGTELANFNVDINALLTVDVDVILRSKVVEMTLVETLKPMIESGELSDFIEPKLDSETDYDWYLGVNPNNMDGDLKPLLLSVQSLNDLGIDLLALDLNAITAVLTVEANLQTLNDSLLSSRILHNSLDKLFTFVLNDSAGINITLDNTSEPTFWQGDGTTEGELIRLLRAVSLVDASDLDPNAFLSLSNTDIHTVALSIIISQVFEQVLIEMTLPGGDLAGQIYVPENLVWHSTSSVTGELEYLLLALKELVPGGDINAADFSLDAILGADVDVLLASKVIEHTAVMTVKPMIESGELSDYIEPKLPGNVDYDWYIGENPSNPNGDLKPLLLAIKGLDDLGLDIQNPDLQAFQAVLAIEANIQTVNDLLLGARIFSNSLDKLFTFVLNDSAGINITLDNTSEPTFWQGDGTNDGELIKMLRAIALVDASDLDPNAFLTLTNQEIHTVALSRVLALVFEAVLLEQTAPGGDLDGQLFIPSGLVWHSTSTENGELENLLLALKELVPGGDIATADLGYSGIIASDLDILFNSKVIEHTAVLTVQPMIESGDLSDYIEPKLPGEVDYVWYKDTDNLQPDGDLLPLLRSIQTLDGLGISFTAFDYAAFAGVLAVEANIQVVNDSMLASRILHNSLDKMFTNILNDSAQIDITLNNSSEPTFWQGDGTNDGELIKLLRGISKLGTGAIDANTVLGLSEANIHTVSLSRVIADIFEAVFTDMVSPTGSNPDLLVIPSGLTWYSTSTETGELEYLLIGLKLLVPSNDIAQANFDVDNLLDLDIDQLVLSKVLEATIAREVEPIITTGALSAFINPTLPNSEPYVWYVDEDPNYAQGDLVPLIKAIRDMRDLGIDYNNFDYASMVAAINTDQKAETLADILLSSRVFEFSLDKMFNQLLITQGGLSIDPIDSSSDPDFWRGDDVNEGELVLVLKAINAADYFNSTDLTTIDNTNSQGMKDALNKINNSSILRPILAEIMDSPALNSAASWKVNPQPTLTKAEWTTEIEVLVDLLVEFNGGFSLDSIDITSMTDSEADDLGVILKLVAQSRLLDINVISSFMKDGLEQAFNTTLTTPLGEVINSPYEDKVTAWNTPTTGEVDILVEIIKGLENSAKNPVGSYQGDYQNADDLGAYFNIMKTSIILGPVVPELVMAIIPTSPIDLTGSVGPIDENTDYVVLLRDFHDDVWTNYGMFL